MFQIIRHSHQKWHYVKRRLAIPLLAKVVIFSVLVVRRRKHVDWINGNISTIQKTRYAESFSKGFRQFLHWLFFLSRLITEGLTQPVSERGSTRLAVGVFKLRIQAIAINVLSSMTKSFITKIFIWAPIGDNRRRSPTPSSFIFYRSNFLRC